VAPGQILMRAATILTAGSAVTLAPISAFSEHVQRSLAPITRLCRASTKTRAINAKLRSLVFAINGQRGLHRNRILETLVLPYANSRQVVESIGAPYEN
jgi:hypothetical protein